MVTAPTHSYRKNDSYRTRPNCRQHTHANRTCRHMRALTTAKQLGTMQNYLLSPALIPCRSTPLPTRKPVAPMPSSQARFSISHHLPNPRLSLGVSWRDTQILQHTQLQTTQQEIATTGDPRAPVKTLRDASCSDRCPTRLSECPLDCLVTKTSCKQSV